MYVIETKSRIKTPILFEEIYDFAGKVREVNLKGIDNSYFYEGYMGNPEKLLPLSIQYGKVIVTKA